MSSKETITQLNSARAIVLHDPAIYPQVVPGVLPVITSSQPLELRRWGAEFLAETFASPVLGADEKGKLALAVLDTLREYLMRKEEVGEEEDAAVLKGAVQCCASVYPLVFRYVISEGEGKGKEIWGKMTGLKSAVLRRLDAGSAGVRICCIKFVARVVQVQTPGLIADPRKPDQNEISLALVPREHPVLVPGTLEAEASGLLDRLLSVFQDTASDAIIVTSTLNALSTLVQRRATIATRILTTILAFNPLQNRTTKTTPVEKIAAKSMTRTTITFLNNILKRSPSHALLPRIQAHIDRLRQNLNDTFSDSAPQNGLKRGPDEPIDGLPPNKRQQLDLDAGPTPPQQQQRAPDGPLPPGPVSYKELYTLTPDPRAAGFHAEALPPQILAQLVPPLLQAVDNERFGAALNAVRARVLEVGRRPPSSALDAGRGVVFAETGGPGGGYGSGPGGGPIGGPHLDVEEEDEEYDPSAVGFGVEAGDGNDPRMLPQQQQRRIVEEAVRLPPDPPLSEQERVEYGEQVRERLFRTLREVDEEVARRKAEKRIGAEEEKARGFNKAVVTPGGGQDREGWITLLIRLATRTEVRVEDGDEEDDEEEGKIKEEGEESSLVRLKHGVGGDSSLPARIRTALNRYIMDDWRRRIDVAIAWLNEEWYADVLASKTASPISTERTTTPPSKAEKKELRNYTPLTLALLDQLLPYLDTKDGRYLIRFLSEIPYLPTGPPPGGSSGQASIFSRIVKLAEDPERVPLASQALLYLIMMRPPVREAAIECAVEIWRGNVEARRGLEKVVGRWRPEILLEGDGEEGVKSEG